MAVAEYLALDTAGLLEELLRLVKVPERLHERRHVVEARRRQHVLRTVRALAQHVPLLGALERLLVLSLPCQLPHQLAQAAHFLALSLQRLGQGNVDAIVLVALAAAEKAARAKGLDGCRWQSRRDRLLTRWLWCRQLWRLHLLLLWHKLCGRRLLSLGPRRGARAQAS